MNVIECSHVDRTRVPYVIDVAQRLSERLDRYLDKAATEVGLVDTHDTVEPSRKPDVVADEMMRSGVRVKLEPITRALKHLVRGLDRGQALAIARFAASAWIESRAAVQLRKALASGPAIAIVNTPQPIIGDWCLLRAGCAGAKDDLEDPEPEPGLFRAWAPVSIVSPGDDAELRAAVERALTEIAKRMSDDDEIDLEAFLAEHSFDESPIVLVLPHVPPRPVLDAVRAGTAGLAQVRFVLMSSPTISAETRAEYADAVFIEPIEPSTAARAIDGHEKARKHIRRLYV
jgi:hypothetical protein